MEKPADTKTLFLEENRKIDRIEAAERMFGTGSKQHLAAIKRFGGK